MQTDDTSSRRAFLGTVGGGALALAGLGLASPAYAETGAAADAAVAVDPIVRLKRSVALEKLDAKLAGTAPNQPIIDNFKQQIRLSRLRHRVERVAARQRQTGPEVTSEAVRQAMVRELADLERKVERLARSLG